MSKYSSNRTLISNNINVPSDGFNSTKKNSANTIYTDGIFIYLET
jgi:hypothetical protein